MTRKRDLIFGECQETPITQCNGDVLLGKMVPREKGMFYLTSANPEDRTQLILRNRRGEELLSKLNSPVIYKLVRRSIFLDYRLEPEKAIFIKFTFIKFKFIK